MLAKSNSSPFQTNDKDDIHMEITEEFKQLELLLEFNQSVSSESTFSNSERFGTFQDSMSAPIHRWFKYPAGFSYKLVEELISDFNLNSKSLVIDPFAGCGTTAVTAKQNGINSIGIEAHPFVYWVAQAKCFWEYDMKKLRQSITNLLAYLQSPPLFPGSDALKNFPELLGKCYSDENLWVLKFIRDSIESFVCTKEEKDFLKIALTDSLRTASKAGTGWPYIAPGKYHQKNELPALRVFGETLWGMYKDLTIVQANCAKNQPETNIFFRDTRQPYPIEREIVDLAITSPPYLNNYDYADRTRLEMYFFGLANSWGDITKSVRNKLIMAATTQVRRKDFQDVPLSQEILDLDPLLYREISEKIFSLSKERLQKGGKKSYDLMVAGYFNDMIKVIEQVYKVLKPGATFALVLGDSAPYGVYIPTEEYLGRLALTLGFRSYHVQNLRNRGEKWKNNTHRHNVLLKEGILFLKK